MKRINENNMTGGIEMKNVVIFGDCGSRSLTRAVISACKSSGGVFAIENGRIYETSDNPIFMVLSTDNISEIRCKKGIIVFGKMLNKSGCNLKIESMIPIIDTSNINAVNIVRNLKTAAVGCSMSGHDTISVSGLTGFSSKIISLQRTIKTLDGEIVEPHDFVVKPSDEIPIYPLLAGCSVLLLSGISTLNGYRF